MQPYSHPGFAGLIGVAREDITPPVGIYARNWGAAAGDVATGIHRPLTLTAVSIHHGSITPTLRHSKPVILIGADLGWWRTPEDEWFVRGGVVEALGLDDAGVILNLSHTHSGPAICRADSDKPGGRLIPAYLDSLRAAAIKAARRAVESREPAVLEWTYGKSTLARHRDLPDPAGNRIVCGFDPDTLVDDTLLVGRIAGQDGKTRATIVNYACHPVSLAWENSLISPDFPGAMRELVEEHTAGAPCLFLQGVSGELAPRDHYSGDPAVADANGRQLGFAVLATLEGMMPRATRLEYAGVVESGAPLATWRAVATEYSHTLESRRITVELPLQPMPTIAEIDALLAGSPDRVAAERLSRKRRVRESVGDGMSTQMPVWLWRVGESVILGVPNEAYSLLQTTLRARFPRLAVCAMNCANGHTGYLPPAELYDHDIYQVWQSPFGRGSLEKTIQACGDAIATFVS